MNKVVAFLEKYAEWLALGIACLFLGYVAYSYVVSPGDQLIVKVGNASKAPGEVDTAINEGPATQLKNAIEAGAADFNPQVAPFAEQFKTAMGPQRDRMTTEYLAGGPVRPGVPLINRAAPVGVASVDRITRLPKVPTPVYVDSLARNYYVAKPEYDENGALVAAKPIDPNAVAAVDGLDKNITTVEFKLSLKDLADEWTKVFPKTTPPAAMLTQFYRVELEREEQTAPNQWGNRVIVDRLPLIKIADYPKEGDAQAQEEYRIWSEKNQVEIAEPVMYQVISTDPNAKWEQPSKANAPVETDPTGATGAAVPFDPANPPARELTSDEKQKVYLYKQKKAQEEQKANAAARKSQVDAAEAARKSKAGGTGTGSGTGTTGGGRRGLGGRGGAGGYAPMPAPFAAPGGGISEENPRGRARPGTAGATPATPARPVLTPARPDMTRREGRPVLRGDSDATMNGGVPTQPFDPVQLTQVKVAGASTDVTIWAHDETAVPGKTYRYRIRVYMKNPIYLSSGLTDDQKLSTQFAIISEPSAWSKPISISKTVLFRFVKAQQDIAGKNVREASVEVYKREKGGQSMATFNVQPGDGIGAVNAKDHVDYATGYTLVDVKADGKDVRIIIADESGDLDVHYLSTDKSNDYLNDLYKKIKAAAAEPAASAGQPSPALVNQIGGR